jgi:hypothetical protein
MRVPAAGGKRAAPSAPVSDLLWIISDLQAEEAEGALNALNALKRSLLP